MEISYSVIIMSANICCFSHNGNTAPQEKRETPTDLYFNILLTNLDVADCEVKTREIVFFNSALTFDDEATFSYFNFLLTFGMVKMLLYFNILLTFAHNAKRKGNTPFVIGAFPHRKK